MNFDWIRFSRCTTLGFLLGSPCHMFETVPSQGLESRSSLEKFHFSPRAVLQSDFLNIFRATMNLVWNPCPTILTLGYYTRKKIDGIFGLFKILYSPVFCTTTITGTDGGLFFTFCKFARETLNLVWLFFPKCENLGFCRGWHQS
jgi:hypothetical protein